MERARETAAPACPACNKPLLLKGSVRRHVDNTRLDYELYECKACGHVRAIGPSGTELLKRVYSGGFHRTSQQHVEVIDVESNEASFLRAPIVKNALLRAQMLRQWEASGRLLDVGAGGGFFVRAASAWFDASGIDISAEAAAIAGRLGARVDCGDFLDPKLTLDTFDVISMWDVLAGFSDPAAALGRAARALRRGGLLVFTVPDIGSGIARVLGRYWPLMIPPINLNFFTAASVKGLLHNAGLIAECIRHDAKHVAVDFLLVKAFRTLGLSNVQSVGISPAVAVRLNLRDIMTVVARRNGIQS